MKDLPKDFKTQTLIELRSKGPESPRCFIPESASLSTCGFCQNDSKLINYCKECSANLCFNCVTQHSKVKILSDHKLTRVKHVVTCSTHNYNADYYCRQCREEMCLVCISTKHANHEDLVKIEDEYAECSRDQDAAISSIKNEHVPHYFQEIEDATEKIMIKLDDLLIPEMILNLRNNITGIKDYCNKFRAWVEMLKKAKLRVLNLKEQKQDKDFIMDTTLATTAIRDLLTTKPIFDDGCQDSFEDVDALVDLITTAKAYRKKCLECLSENGHCRK